MEFSLYIGSTKAKHVIDYTFSKNACIILSRAKMRYSLDKAPRKTRRYTKSVTYQKVVPIVSKNQINIRLIPKLNK
jgi:hypothetical protein